MLHIIGLPHTLVNQDFNICAYTQKLRKFQLMFPNENYYFNEGSDGEYVQIYSKEDMERLFDFDWWKSGEIYKVQYDKDLPYWREFNHKVIVELSKRIKPGDLILNISGSVQKEISDAFLTNITCEFGVGYEGVFSNFKVFESYAWMHAIYGHLYGAARADGKFFDAVIPNYFDISEFRYQEQKEDYVLFMSRPIDRKGIQIVKDMGERGIKIKTAGKEKLEGKNIEWVGYADSQKRAELMGKAKALLCPTLYLEPFGGVVVEAALCGTPAITTDWGAFPETVEQGKTGFRCHMLGEFIAASEKVKELDPNYIRTRAKDLYSLEAVKPQYEKYFERLVTLYGKGWYS